MTLGALNAIHGLGLQIPGDIAVVGFDDMPWATSLAPPLTVVAQPQHELGRCAAELIQRRLSGHVGEARQVRLQPRLIVRESCGALPTASI